VPVYKLTVTTEGKDGKKVVKKVKMEFREWFDEKGAFITKPFQRMLASSIPVIGKADPKNAVPKKEKVKEVDNRSMDEKWASLLAESSGAVEGETNGTSSGAAATPGKGKKRGKKA
jgi:hypothetical protein